MNHNLPVLNQLRFDYDASFIGNSLAIHADCFEWLSRLPESTLHAVVTDPPYGVKEYDADQLEKRAAGSGGSRRIPPSFDGSIRAPLPRFTALDLDERRRLHAFITSGSTGSPHSSLRSGDCTGPAGN
jgi:site-specific DNA-methyltransferase (adenine-specific)